MRIEGCDAARPYDSLCVVMRLDDGRQQPVEANAVAAHYGMLCLAVYIHIRHADGYTVARPQLEAVPELDSPLDAQCAATSCADCPIVGFSDIAYLGHLEITRIVRVNRVVSWTVCSGDEISHPRKRLIADDSHARSLSIAPHRQPDRAGVSRLRANIQSNCLLACRFKRVGPCNTLELRLINVQITAQHDQERFFA